LYGDLKNYRKNDMTFDIKKFVSFEGNTGPYLLYSYARARNILKKSKNKSSKIKASNMTEKEKNIILALEKFPDLVKHAAENLSPNLIANYAFEISQKFNEYYHSEQVIGSENEELKLKIVDAFSIVLKNALNLLGIETLEKM